MATKKISELEEMTESFDSDVLVIVNTSEGTTNKITKGNLLIGSGNSIEMEIDPETYQLTLTLKNAAGTELSTASIDLPNEDAITEITYSNGALTLTKQSGETSTVDISEILDSLKELIGIDENTYETTNIYNIGDIVIQNEKIYKCNQDNVTGTFDITKWDEISLYEYQKIQDEKLEDSYKRIAKLEQENAELRENELINEVSGTSLNIKDSAKATVRRVELIGHSEQKSTNNLLNLSSVGPAGTDYNEKEPTLANGIVNIKGKNNTDYNTKGSYRNGYVNCYTTQLWKASTKYYLSCKIDVVSNVKELDSSYFRVLIGGALAFEIHYNSSTKRYEGNFTTPNTLPDGIDNKLYLEFRADGMELNISEISLKTVNDYTFNGYGISPSPQVPQEIHRCGEDGSINEKIENKNYLPTENINKKQAGVTITSQLNGSLLFNGTKYGSNLFSLNNNIFTLKEGNYTLGIRKKGGDGTSPAYVRFVLYNADNNISEFTKEVYIAYIQNYWQNNRLMNFTVEKKSNYYLQLIISDNTVFNELDLEIVIYKGTLDENNMGDFIPHAEQNISFPLKEGQVLAEGDYIDDDGVHHKRGKVVFNGTEDWSTLEGQNTDNTFYLSSTILDSLAKTNTEVLCNIASNGSVWGTDIANTVALLTNYSKLRFRVSKTFISSAEEFKAWLAEQYANGTPVEVEYELAEEVTEEFTTEQALAWEQIKAMRTYKNVTHVSSEDETKATVEMTYVRDTQTYIDNRLNELETRVEVIESEV